MFLSLKVVFMVEKWWEMPFEMDILAVSDFSSESLACALLGGYFGSDRKNIKIASAYTRVGNFNLFEQRSFVAIIGAKMRPFS